MSWGEFTDALEGSCSQNTLKNKRLSTGVAGKRKKALLIAKG
jgi:hypothetical protein